MDSIDFLGSLCNASHPELRQYALLVSACRLWGEILIRRSLSSLHLICSRDYFIIAKTTTSIEHHPQPQTSTTTAHALGLCKLDASSPCFHSIEVETLLLLGTSTQLISNRQYQWSGRCSNCFGPRRFLSLVLFHLMTGSLQYGCW